MRDVDYHAEPGWQEGLEAQPQMAKGMNKTAKVVASTAKSIAPEGPTGNYRKLIYAFRDAVYAHDFAWHWVEFGSTNNKPYGVLRRAVIAAGLKFKPSPKP